MIHQHRCLNRRPQAGSLDPETFLSQGSARVLVSHLPSLQTAAFSLWPPEAERERARAGKPSGAPCDKGPNTIWGFTLSLPSKPHHLPKAPPPKPYHLGA